MSEVFEFELRLIDSVSKGADRAAMAVRGIKAQAEKVKPSLDFSKELGRSEAALKKIHADPKGFRDLMKVQKELSEHRKQIKKSVGGESFGEAFKAKLGFSRMVSASFFGDLLAEGLIEGIKKPIEMFAEGIKEAFKAIGDEQQRRAGYDLTLGKKDSKEAREHIEGFSSRTAFSSSQNQDMMLPLFRAGLKGKAADQAYATSLDLAAGRGKGADSGAVNEAVELFAKIQQKGGITAKQLSGVGLGEDNVPAFFKELGKAHGMSAADAQKKAAEPGGFQTQELMNAITAAVNKMQGGKAGTGGEGEGGGKSLKGRWNKLMRIPEDMFEKLADSKGLAKISGAIDRVLKKLDPDGPLAGRIFAALNGAFETLAEWVDRTFTTDNIDAFANAFKEIPSILSKVVTAAELLATIWVGSKLVNMVNGAVQFAAVLTGLGAAAVPLLAVGAALASIAFAFIQISDAIKELGGFDKVLDDLDHFVNGKDAIAKGNPLNAALEEENRKNVEAAHARQAVPVSSGDSGEPKGVVVHQTNHIQVDASGHGDDESGAMAKRAARKTAIATEEALQKSKVGAGLL